MAKVWIAATRVGDESVRHYDIQEVGETETQEEATRRVLKPEWEGIGAALINYSPTKEDIDEVLSEWNIFFFHDEDEVAKLKKIDPPDYVHDLSFAVSEMWDAIFRAFTDETIPATAETIY